MCRLPKTPYFPLSFSDSLVPDENVFLFPGVAAAKNDNSNKKNNEPRFIDQIQNVTVAVGRDATLTCQVEQLNSYRVRLPS